MGAFYHRHKRHWKTEVVAASIEMLSGRRKKDYAAEALAAQAAGQGADGLDDVDDAAAAVAAAEPEADGLEIAAVA